MVRKPQRSRADLIFNIIIFTVKDHSDSMDYSFRLAARDILYASSHTG